MLASASLSYPRVYVPQELGLNTSFERQASKLNIDVNLEIVHTIGAVGVIQGDDKL